MLGGLTIHRPVVHFLQCLCAKNYENRLRVFVASLNKCHVGTLAYEPGGGAADPSESAKAIIFGQLRIFLGKSQQPKNKKNISFLFIKRKNEINSIPKSAFY